MTCDAANYTLRLNTGVVDPVLGTSYIQFAMQGLRHQQSQGAGNWTVEPGDRFTFYKLVDSVVESPKDKDGHEQSFFDGIDTTLPGLAARLGDEEKKVPWLRGELAAITSEIKHASEKSESDPTRAAEPLSKAVQRLDSAIDRLKTSGITDAAKKNVLPILEAKQQEAERAANIAFNVHLEATVASGPDPGKTAPPFKDALTVVSPGQTFQVIARLHNGSDHWLLVENAEMDGGEGWIRQADAGEMTIGPSQNYYANFALKVPADAAATRPYWHRDNPETDALNTIDEERYRTLPFPPPPLRVRVQYEVVEHRARNSPAPDVIRNRGAKKEAATNAISATVFVPFTDQSGTPLQDTSGGCARILSESRTRRTGSARTRRERDHGEGRREFESHGSAEWNPAAGTSARLEIGAGPVSGYLVATWRRAGLSFKLFPASLQEGRVEVRAVLDAGGKRYSEGYSLVTREDLGAAYYYQPAVQRVSVVDVKVPKDLKVGYVMGAGDEIPTVLEQIGMDVTLIPAEKLARKI